MSEASQIAAAVQRFEETTARLTQQLEGLVKDLRDERERNERTYVRADVYAAHRTADEAKLREVEKDVTEINTGRLTDAGFRRQVLVWGAGLSITTVVSAAIAVANIVSR